MNITLHLVHDQYHEGMLGTTFAFSFLSAVNANYTPSGFKEYSSNKTESFIKEGQYFSLLVQTTSEKHVAFGIFTQIFISQQCSAWWEISCTTGRLIEGSFCICI